MDIVEWLRSPHLATRESHEAADEIERLRGEKKWQPIETAPKNQEILVWDGKNIWLVDAEYEMYPKDNGCGCCSSSVHNQATHWMPLPESPK